MKMRIFTLVIMTLFIFVYSCKKDEGPTVEENKETLESLSTIIEADLDQVLESEGMDAMDAMIDFFSLDDPLGLNFDLGLKKSTLPEKSYQPSDLAKRFTGVLGTNDDGFDFDALTGTYTWNESIERWSVDPTTPTDKIVIVFPIEGYSDDAVFTIYEFDETMVLDTYYDFWGYLVTDTIYQPNRIHVDLKIGSETYVTIDATAEWDEVGDPESLDVYLLFKPLELQVTFDNNGSKMMAGGWVKLDGTKIISTELAMDYTMEEDEWGDEEIVPSSISGFVHYGPIKINGTADVEELMQMEEEPTLDDINAAIDLVLYDYSTDTKIADLVIVEGQEDEPDIQLKFTDGSTEMAGVYFDPIIESLEEKLEELEGLFDEEAK
jgi:hypothetical protein